MQKREYMRQIPDNFAQGEISLKHALKRDNTKDHIEAENRIHVQLIYKSSPIERKQIYRSGNQGSQPTRE